MPRRLLLARGGGGGFTIPEALRSLTAAPNGGWPGVTSAVAYNGTTFVGYNNGSDGSAQVVAYDNLARTSVIGTLKAAWANNHHNYPAVLPRRSDGRLVAIYAAQSSSHLYRRISTNPADVSAWDAETDLIGSVLPGGGPAYPILWQLTSESDTTIWLWFRDESGGSTHRALMYSKSTDGGSTWSAATNVYEAAGKEAYCRIESNGADRFDFAVTDGTVPTDDASVYHFYWTGGSYYQTDGTLITASLPLTPADLMLVHSGAGGGARYISSVTRGPNPAISWPEQPGGNEHVFYGRWTGSAWSVHDVVSFGAAPGTPLFEGGSWVDPDAPGTMFVSLFTSGQWEIWRYVTTDNGATWTTTQLTSGSTDEEVYPVVVRNHTTGLRVVWLNGTFTSPSARSQAIKGWG